MTKIVAVDPGVTIGLAWLDGSEFDAFQTKDIFQATYWLRNIYLGDDPVFVVENYLSSGHLTKEAFATIKLVGFFQYWLQEDFGTVVLAPPQSRLSGLPAAKKMAETRGIEGPHSWDALAHAVVAARKHAG